MTQFLNLGNLYKINNWKFSNEEKIVKKKLLILTALFVFIATSGLCGSPYTGAQKKDEKESTNPGAQYHMMLYEQAEKNAEEQYAIITEEPDEKKNAEEGTDDNDSEKNAEK